MVKIRLRRTGSKHRPFYRVVVAKSTAGRDGSFIEVIGTYNPVTKPKLINIKEDRALHWLLSGAQPSETAAIIMNRAGILEKFLEQRPAARKQFKFLDKRTAAMSVQSVVAPVAVEKAEPAPKPEPEPAEVSEVSSEIVEESPVDAASGAEPEGDSAIEAEPDVEEPAAESKEGEETA